MIQTRFAEKVRTHFFMFNNFFSKITLFMR